MPGTAKQDRFMRVVHAMQKGKIPKSGKAGKAATQMDPEDVKHWLQEKLGYAECGPEVKQRILTTLKELVQITPQEPSLMEREEEEGEQSVIASTKSYRGDYKKTINMYKGLPLTAQELQAINSFTVAKPVKWGKDFAGNPIYVQYSREDVLGQTLTITVMKLREANVLYYIGFVRNRPSSEEGEEEAPQTGQPAPAPEPEQIKIVKSTPIDDKEGSEILTNFIGELYHKNI